MAFKRHYVSDIPGPVLPGRQAEYRAGGSIPQKMGRDIYVHKSWEERPLFGPMEGKEFYDPCDFFGGDLEGIKKRLDELKSLGLHAFI